MAIVDATKQYVNASQVIPGLKKNGFDIGVSFTAKETNSGGIDFEVFGLGFDGGADIVLTAQHSVKVSFN